LPSIPYSIDASIALQGAFAEHFQTIQSLSSKSLTKTETPLPRLNPRLVRTKEDLDACDALIIPGGESTTMAIVAKNMGLLDSLRDFVKVQGKPTWGTCAGAILLSEGGVEGSKKGGQDVIGGIDIRIGRNGFGSQVIQIVEIAAAVACSLITFIG
jgi:5'-phosphate synthase pdxT subunit